MKDNIWARPDGATRTRFQGLHLEPVQSPHFCKKHKEFKEYDKYQHGWICESCWAEEHGGKGAVIYQLRPKPERVIGITKEEPLGKNIP